MGCAPSEPRFDNKDDEATQHKHLMKLIKKSVPNIIDLNQLVTHIKKAKSSNLSLTDSQTLRGLVACGKQQGFTNGDDGLFKWNTGKIIGKNINLVKPYGNFSSL